MFPKKLQNKLNDRKANNALRQLGVSNNLVDFSSNDYLGFSKNKAIFSASHQYLVDNNIQLNGATGSRLLSGNHKLYNEVEAQLCQFYNSESALIFNSGYDANIGFFSSVPQRGDIIFYDEFIHASIRDGISMSNAKAYKFKHNSLKDLQKKILRFTLNDNHQIYIVTESVFSMDGDTPDLVSLTTIAKQYNGYIIVDEAHAIGVFGPKGSGLVQQLGLENDIFARIVTYGKALGCHGAAVLGTTELYTYLVNFSRSLIYTTGLSPHAIATIQIAYNHLQDEIIHALHEKINHFIREISRLELTSQFTTSNSAIHCCIIADTSKTIKIATQLQEKGFNIKPILSPTVPEGQERLRFCLHSFNTTKHITAVLEQLATFIKN